MECYRVRVHAGQAVRGFNVRGERKRIIPGEHLVHRVVPSVPAMQTADTLRFVGADASGADLHVPIPRGAPPEKVLPVEVIGAAG